MKKLILFAAIAIALSSCTTTEKITSATSGEATNGDYQLLENKRTESSTKQIYFLFIPIGGKDDETLKTECFNTLIKETAADGMFNANYIITRVRYPFYGTIKVELQARPFKLKQK